MYFIINSCKLARLFFKWIYLRALIQIDIWHLFKVRCSTCVIHEAVYVSEDVKTASCRDCNLGPNGSVKTKACSSTRLLIWVHIWEAGSQTLTAASLWGLDVWLCCHWTACGGGGGGVLKPGAAVTSSSRSGLGITYNVALIETLRGRRTDNNTFLVGTRANCQFMTTKP